MPRTAPVAYRLVVRTAERGPRRLDLSLRRAPHAPTADAERPWRSKRGDIAIVIVVLAFQLFGLAGASWHQHAHRDLDAGGVIIAALGPLLLLFCRRWPAPIGIAVLAVTLVYWNLGYPRGPIFIALIVAYASLVHAGYRRLAVLMMVVGYPGFLWLPMLTVGADAPSLQFAAGVAAWLLVLVATAEIARARRWQRAEDRQRRAEEERRRASEERLQIAREVHDVLAHTISVINVQAGVGLHLMARRPEQAEEALTIIKETSAEALRELRGLVGVLRQNSGEVAPRDPTHGLDRIDALAASASASGVRVSTEMTGHRRSVPAPVDLAAYRIVQEALTNVARYSRPPVARIGIDYGANELTVLVDDDGLGAPLPDDPNRPLSGGNGIAGMRERAVALGGDLQAGPRPDGGFRVRATLPLDTRVRMETV